MGDNPTEQVLSDLFQYLEDLETQCRAIAQFLKDKGVASDDEFSRYLTQAGEASSVKWRAARVRMEHLFAATPERAGKAPETGKDKTTEAQQKEQAKKEFPKAEEKATAENKAVATSKQGDESKPVETSEHPEEPQGKPSAEADQSGSGQRRDFKSNASEKNSEGSGSEPKAAESTKKKTAERSPQSDQPSAEKVA